MTLDKVIAIIRPNFFLDKNAEKPYQTVEYMEGNKSAAIVMIIGISNLFNVDRKEVMEELDIDYDEYRNKLSLFSLKCEECAKGKPENLTGELKRFYNKLRLVQNALYLNNKNQALSIGEILSI